MPPQAKPTYILAHEVLPYNLERSLPFPVIDSIYSFIRPKSTQRIERLKISLNHKISARNELLYVRYKRNAIAAQLLAKIIKIDK